MDKTANNYQVSRGTVQCYITGFTTSPFIQHYGRAEYERDKPVLTDSLREQGQAVCDDLNAGRVAEDEARIALKRIYF